MQDSLAPQQSLEQKKAPLALQIAAGLFIVEGLITLLDAASHPRGESLSPDILPALAPSVIAVFSGALSVGAGVGILMRRPVWRFIGALGIGSSLGSALAIFVFSTWPLGPNAWSIENFLWLLLLAPIAWQFWAVTNVAAQIYFLSGSKKAEPTPGS